MEMMRRYGAGRLAEIFGEQASAIDRQMRVLGLYRLAEAAFSHLSAPVQRGARSLRRRGQRVSGDAPRRAAAGVPAAALHARAVAAGRQPGLGQADGPGARPAITAASCCAPASPAALSPEQLAFLYPEYPKDAPTTWRSWRRSTASCRSTALYAGTAASDRPDLRLEQLGRRRRAQRERQAAAGQRSASRLCRSRRLVSRPAQDAGARDRRRHRRRACRLS